MVHGALVFDRKAVRAARARAMSFGSAHDALLAEAAERLADRLDDMRGRFPLAVDIGCRGGVLGRRLAGRGGIATLVAVDLGPEAVAPAPGLALVADEEVLPFAAASLDAVLSSLAFHWVNDLPGVLVQVRRALRSDGLLLASLFGPETLAELREAFAVAEAACEGGASPRVAPFPDPAALPGLLQRAGFREPVVDSDRLVLDYPDPLALLRDLRGMGETNPMLERRKGFTRRATMLRMMEEYRARFAEAATGRIRATFQLVTVTAWAP
jgi:SAM-dependent methyltransferase